MRASLYSKQANAKKSAMFNVIRLCGVFFLLLQRAFGIASLSLFRLFCVSEQLNSENKYFNLNQLKVILHRRYNPKTYHPYWK